MAQPQPGRVLTETYNGNGSVTTFTVDPDPRPGPRNCTLRIQTVWAPQPGLMGAFERIIAPRVLSRLYQEELDLIQRWAQQRENPSGHQRKDHQ